MDATIALARFWGWIGIISGLVFLLRGKAWVDERLNLVGDKAFTLLGGYMTLMVGLMSVILHNMWGADWRIVVTLCGWLNLLKGVHRLAFPDAGREKAAPALKERPLITKVTLVALAALGGWLVWRSYQ
jgi:hypothetical protein